MTWRASRTTDGTFRRSRRQVDSRPASDGDRFPISGNRFECYPCGIVKRRGKTRAASIKSRKAAKRRKPVRLAARPRKKRAVAKRRPPVAKVEAKPAEPAAPPPELAQPEAEPARVEEAPLPRLDERLQSFGDRVAHALGEAIVTKATKRWGA